MKIKVVLSKAALDKLWALGAAGEPPMLPGGLEGIVELDDVLISTAIDLFEEPTFSQAIERVIDAKIWPPAPPAPGA